MDFKKKTIIWEDNNEPPKDYIWAKKDGKFYEYSYATRNWIESKLIKAEESGENGNSGKSERFTLADLFMEIKKSEMEQFEQQGESFTGELLYPDTFVTKGLGDYTELPRSAALPFLMSPNILNSAIPAYTNPPTINDNTWVVEKFTGDPKPLSGISLYEFRKIVTIDGTSEGGCPPRELYILVNNVQI